ncbi:hypothetical protein D3C85_1147510 [compost metagenome]
MIPGQDRRILEGGSWAKPVGAVIELVKVAVHDDEASADHVVLAPGSQRPFPGAETAVELFGGHITVRAARKAAGIAIAKGCSRHERAAGQQAEVGLQRIVQLDTWLYVELLPVDFRAVIFAAAHIDAAAAEVDVSGGKGRTAGGEVDLTLEVAVLEGVARQRNVGGQG